MKKSKFLSIGVAAVLAAGLYSSNTNAESVLSNPVVYQVDEETKKNIIEGILNIIKEKKAAGFLKEESHLKVNIERDTKILDPETKEEKLQKADLSDNHIKLIENVCKINLAFDNMGNSPKLGGNDEILNETNFTNSKQKQIMREFIALHESFHCEFSNIENPIVVEGKSSSFNEKINYYLKDMPTLPIEGFGQLGYIDTLNENFADIGATGLLLKKYGKDDIDLQFVLKANKTQRHATYLAGGIDNHFTHIGLKNSMEENMMDKMISTKNGEEYRKIVLGLANKSVQQLMAQRKDLTEEMFTDKALQMNFIASVIRFINYEVATSKERNTFALKSYWKNDTKKGIISELASTVLEGKNIKEKFKKSLDFNDSSNMKERFEMISYASELLENKNISYFLSRDIKNFPEYMKEFKEIVYQQNEPKINDFDNLQKGDVISKMLQLRNNFTQEVQKHGVNLINKY